MELCSTSLLWTWFVINFLSAAITLRCMKCLCCNLWAHLRVSVVCWSWNSVAFIEASLEELPVSAKLGQSCLATKISAPGPSSFGWFCHSRSACPGHDPPPTSSGRLSWASLSDPRWGLPVLTCLNWVLAPLLVHLSLNWRSYIFYDFMSGQSVLVTCILAPKHNLHFLKGKVWFREFIG